MWRKCLNENKEKKSLSNLLARHICPHAERLGRCSESLTNSTALVTGEENKKAPKPSFSHLVTSCPIMKQAFSFSPNFGGYNKLHPGASLPSKENLLPIPNLSICLFPGFPQSGGLLTASPPASPCPPKAHGHTHWGLSARVLLVLESCREAAFLPLLHRSLCGRVCGTHRETDAKAPFPCVTLSISLSLRRQQKPCPLTHREERCFVKCQYWCLTYPIKSCHFPVTSLNDDSHFCRASGPAVIWVIPVLQVTSLTRLVRQDDIGKVDNYTERFPVKGWERAVGLRAVVLAKSVPRC